MPSMLLLLDVDSVLIAPRGYRVALRATIDHFALAMGQPPFALTEEENVDFEALGIGCEWDSAPMCVGAMLTEALTRRPDLARPTVAATLDAIRGAGLSLPRPDPVELARAVSHAVPDGAQPTETICTVLKKRTPEVAHHLLDELLNDNFTIKSPTTYVFQHFVLGSQRFADLYAQPAGFETESALITHDRPLLAPAVRDQLLARAAAGDIGAAIFTARPSLPPTDLLDGACDFPGCSPDADLAAEMLGLDGRLPLIAIGRLAWAAEQHRRDVAEYIKPSPVQALAAIGAAFAGQETAAVQAAATLHETGRLSGSLAAMANQPVRVAVFEDTASGIRAVQTAVELLRRTGLAVTLEANGIAPEAAKREQLARVADRVFDDINQALEPYLAA